jgi:hypothetical protein
VDDAGKLRNDCTDDGMHCNSTGYKIWKPLVEEVLKAWAVQ